MATYGLAQALGLSGVQVAIILPYPADYAKGNFKLYWVFNKTSPSPSSRPISPYNTSQVGFQTNFLKQTDIYAQLAAAAAKNLKFNLIHAHDWMTLPAGLYLKKLYHRPLIAHLHTIEADRAANQAPNPTVYKIEKEYLPQADVIIANSQYTKNRAIKAYNLCPDKMSVVHNAYSELAFGMFPSQAKLGLKDKKVVLFVARLSMHKGADYFLRAAQIAARYDPKLVFVIAGDGEMQGQLVDLAAQLDIADKVFFTGFLRGEKLKNLYRRANVYVLPSVSEPFGITVLEAISQKTPVIVSKTAGVAEVMPHLRQVDFWDVNQLASAILEVLRYPALSQTLITNSYRQLKQLTWKNAATKVIDIYRELLPAY